MTNNKNNIPIYEEQQFIQEEQQIEQTTEETIADLREQLKVLQKELAEKEEENEELNKLVWKGIEKLNKKGEEEKQIKTSLNNFKSKLLGSLFRNRQKKKRIRELNNSLSFLRGLLTEKNQEVINLVNERNNLQTQVNDLNRMIKNQNQTTNDLQDENERLKEKNIDNYKKETVVELVSISASSRPLLGRYTTLNHPELIDKGNNIWENLSSDPVSLVTIRAKEFQAIKLSEEKSLMTMNEYWKNCE